MRKILHPIKGRAVGSKTIKIHKTEETEERSIKFKKWRRSFFFLPRPTFKKYIRVKLPLLSFINCAGILTLLHCCGKIVENPSRRYQWFSGIYRSQAMRWLGVACNLITFHILCDEEAKNSGNFTLATAYSLHLKPFSVTITSSMCSAKSFQTIFSF